MANAGAAAARSRVGYRADIDGLRALAVSLVIGFHAFPRLVPGGFIGVDIFFVISGFLITGVLLRQFDSAGASGWSALGNFYGRRIRRIFPSLVVVLLACMALGGALLLPSELAKLGAHILACAGFVVNFSFAREAGYFGGDAFANPVLHLWSLAVEEQFYLLWPLLVWLTVIGRVRFLPVAVFVTAASLFWTIYEPDVLNAGNFFLPQMRLWELALGGCAAAIVGCGSGAGAPRSLWARLGFNLLSLAGLLLIAAGLHFITGAMSLPNASLLFPTAGTALLLCAPATTALNRLVFAPRPLVWLGTISYPLYLWHWPLLSFARISLDQGDSTRLTIAAIAASVLLAWLTVRFIEGALRRGGHAGQKIGGLLAGMGLAATLGYAALRTGGFPARLPPLLRDLTGYQYDYRRLWREGRNFLINSQDERDFPSDVSEIKAPRPVLYLWGDSFAASLYPGLVPRLGDRYNIVQRTAAAIPPMVDTVIPARPQGRAINRYVLDSIRRLHPACVVLAANWPEYDWEKVDRTITALQEAGIPRIVLVGPLPYWKVSLPQQLFNHFRRHPFERLPLRMWTGVDERPARVDEQMAREFTGRGIDYVSACGLLRNEGGYLVRVGDTPESLVTFDAKHLTGLGAVYLVAHFPAL